MPTSSAKGTVLSANAEWPQQPLVLAVIAGEQTPYRLHLHRRIRQELPEVELWSLFTHEMAVSPWQYDDDREIRPVLFGKGERNQENAKLRAAVREWRRGGEIIRWLQDHRVAAIVIYGYDDTARLRIIRWARRSGVRCFLFGDSNIRGDCATGLRALIKRIYVPWILRQTTGVFHCGRLGREYFLRYGVPSHRLYPFPYEPDYSVFAGETREEDSATLLRHGLPVGRRYVLFVGRMIEAKRPDLLVKAFSEIAAERPDWDLVLVGDGPLRPQLEVQIAAPLRDRIHSLGFIADTRRLADLYSVCDVFVLPSDREPWGVVLTEAATRMALIASSAVGAAADLIEEGVNGRTFSPGSLPGLRSALLQVTDSQAIDRMRLASPRVLARWRESTDPVRNLRNALHDAGLLAGSHQSSTPTLQESHSPAGPQ